MYQACGIVRLCFTAGTVSKSPTNPSRIERSLRGRQRVTSKDTSLRETSEKPAITRKRCRETIPLNLRILKSCALRSSGICTAGGGKVKSPSAEAPPRSMLPGVHKNHALKTWIHRCHCCQKEKPMRRRHVLCG